MSHSWSAISINCSGLQLMWDTVWLCDSIHQRLAPKRVFTVILSSLWYCLEKMISHRTDGGCWQRTAVYLCNDNPCFPSVYHSLILIPWKNVLHELTVPLYKKRMYSLVQIDGAEVGEDAAMRRRATWPPMFLWHKSLSSGQLWVEICPPCLLFIFRKEEERPNLTVHKWLLLLW